METFADRMRKMTVNVRGDTKSYKEFKDTKDITTFFEEEVKKHALAAIEKRAVKGHFNANILEYGFLEYFYVTSEGSVVRVPKFEKRSGVYMHRILTVVHSGAFQKMLNEFVGSLGNMRVSCWYPGRDSVNVVTVNWGTPKPKERDPAPEPAPESPTMTPRSVDMEAMEAMVADIVLEEKAEKAEKAEKEEEAEKEEKAEEEAEEEKEEKAKSKAKTKAKGNKSKKA